MTMPFERTRALRWAGEFLDEIQKSTDVSPELRRQASVILRHYPNATEIATEAKICSKSDRMWRWLGPEDERI